jgi:hypothetical protein
MGIVEMPITDLSLDVQSDIELSSVSILASPGRKHLDETLMFNKSPNYSAVTEQPFEQSSSLASCETSVELPIP